MSVRQIVYKLKTSNTIVTLPRSGRPTKITPRARHVIVQEVTRDPRVMSRKLKDSLAVATVNVYESTIRGTFDINDVHGRVARSKPLLSKKNTAVRPLFAKDRVAIVKMWTDKTKIKLSGLNEKRHVWQRANTAFQQKNLISSMKDGGGSIMVWAALLPLNQDSLQSLMEL